jgi:ring-1,2-phenylacetyl-CoA epoxidase subunit PaaC
MSAKTAAPATAAPPQVRDLILVLADCKRVLGMRYAEWLLGAPELEAGIACASMAQDEWGHARLLYSMLREFGDDVDAIEHGRDAAEYRSIDVLDREPDSWTELVVLNAFVDGAFSIQLEALAGSSYLPLRQRVQKLLEEEQFHAAHGRAWILRLARAGDASRAEVAAAIRACIPSILAWFGPDAGPDRLLHELGIVDAFGSAMRTRYLERVAPFLEAAGVSSGTDAAHTALQWNDFDASTRRTSAGAPDERTIAKIRGDKNRAFLMD